MLVVITGLRADTFLEGPNQFDIEFVTIGSPGNEPFRNDSGDVAYEYRMGKFEISRQQIQLANQLGELEISISKLDYLIGGPRPEMPANGVSTNKAARFVNWLNEMKGLPHAYKFEFQPGEEGYNSNAWFGVWEPSEAGYNPDNILRNALAEYVVPTDQEWVKAAYYNPNYNDGLGGTSVTFQKKANNTWQNSNGVLVDVMAAGKDRVNGLVGMTGNVWELNETSGDLVITVPRNPNQRIRGGGWLLAFPNENSYGPGNYEFSFYSLDSGVVGFRVASVPEPSGCMPVGFASVFALGVRKRRSTSP